MIDSIIDRLKKLDLELTPEEIADILWLGIQMQRASPAPGVEESSDASRETKQPEITVSEDFSPRIFRSSVSQASTVAYLSTSSNTGTGNTPTPSRTTVFKTPEAPALRNPLLLARAMRPLMQKYPSRTQTVLDEEATVNRIADEAIWLPVEKPAPERWFDLVMVVEESPSVAIWRKEIEEWRQLVKHHGAFRDVRTWYLREGSRADWQLYPTSRSVLNRSRHPKEPLKTSASNRSRPRHPKELLETSGRQLILFVSDCVSSLWQEGKVYPLLETWTKQSSVSILQLMPERYWERSVLGRGRFVQFGTFLPEPLNTQLWVEALPSWKTPLKLKTALKLPVITFDPNSLGQWAKVMTGNGNTTTAGVVFESSQTMMTSRRQSATDELSGVERVRRFRATASLPARQLAGLMAAAPVSLPVARLIQQTMLPNSNQAHLAEVFLSGLIRVADEADMNLDAEHIRYQFLPDVRESLLQAVPVSDTDEVLDRVSAYIARRVGLSIRSFDALLAMYPTLDEEKRRLIEPFAQVAPQVLRRLGGVYAEIADELELSGSGGAAFQGETRIPVTLKTFEFDVATISIGEESSQKSFDVEEIDFEGIGEVIIGDEEIDTEATVELKTFEFETVKVNDFGQELERVKRTARYFVEYLGREPVRPGTTLGRAVRNLMSGWRRVDVEMVAIPGGTFLMGSPKDEAGRSAREGPQHTVTLNAFFLGKYPVTQAQWSVVAALPQVNRKLNSDPSRFKGNDRPVENITWYDAVEFCDRLSQYAGRQYRLPSEAEWEYACRAGTTTSFHFGETITTDLANYNGTYAYGSGPEGIYRKETTPVGSSGVANAFGLYDMHGNVFEWCADLWDDNYESAPIDGSAWIIGEERDRYVLRGGSWVSYPQNCRSAYRNWVNVDDWEVNAGFRVACSA